MSKEWADFNPLTLRGREFNPLQLGGTQRASAPNYIPYLEF